MTSSRTAPIDTASADGRRTAGAQTRARLLAAASEILSTEGEPGLTVRAISAAAGANIAAVNYHFGSREALIRAVVAQETDDIGRAQQTAFDELEARDPPPAVSDWVAAWARPLMSVALGTTPDARRIGRIVGQMHAAPAGTVEATLHASTADADARLLRGLARALPDITEADRVLRLALMASALSGFASGVVDHLLGEADPSRDLQERVLSRLIAIAAAPN